MRKVDPIFARKIFNLSKESMRCHDLSIYEIFQSADYLNIKRDVQENFFIKFLCFYIHV